MKFREIVESPCGIRYLFDELGLQSGYARKVLLDREMMVDPDRIDAAYASLRKYFDLVLSDRRRVEDMRFRLQGLRDISGTLASLAGGATLDEIEFFEIKHLAMLAQSLSMGTELETVIDILDPDGLRIGTFYLYDSYSVALRQLRDAVEQDPDDSQLQEDLANEEDRLKKVISDKLRPYAASLQQTLRELADLDISLAQAIQMHVEGLILPSSGSATTITGMFHPGVRAALRAKGREFQPVDFAFERGVPATVIGANMGGKTVALKTLCMLQYLYQFGFGLPAVSAVMTPFDEIRFCIGDEQDEKTGLSSFAAEMQRIDRAVAVVEKGGKVLLLVDEPARTTNPVEGTALVAALLQRLADKPNLALVMTTHYTVEHAGQCWRVQGLLPGTKGRRMDYRLVRTASHEVPHEALNIARELGIDAQWIDLADTIMKRQYE
jgi:dsDNA-specific endonuclease/ATPase MutS2